MGSNGAKWWAVPYLWGNVLVVQKVAGCLKFGKTARTAGKIVFSAEVWILRLSEKTVGGLKWMLPFRYQKRFRARAALLNGCCRCGV